MKQIFTLLFLTTLFFLKAQLVSLELPISFRSELTASTQLNQELMPSFDLEKMLVEDANNEAKKVSPWRFGKNFNVNYTLSNSGLWDVLPNGDRIWRIRISSAEALSMNVIFDTYYIPEGAHLQMYNVNQTHIVGAYTSLLNNASGIIGSEVVQGDDIIIEYYEPQAKFGQGILEIGTVTHGYKKLSLYGQILIDAYDSSGNCNHDVECPTGSGWESQIASVAMIVVGGNGACTGALVNNTNNDGTPYFLTANHCLGNPASWVFRFNWHAITPSCGTNANSGNGSYDQTTFNSTLVASNPGSDFALVLINGTIPNTWNPFYAGWDRSDAIPTNTTGIHHPSGDLKKICRDNDASSYSTYNGAATWEVDNWDIGVTEPGSSGSPLFDQNKRIIGQLYGGAAACNGTNDNGQPDYYGRFATSWDSNSSTTRLKDWLDPSNSNVTIINGYDPNAAVVSLDAGINSIINPIAEICGASFTPEVQLKNYGSNNLTSCQIRYQTNGGAVQTFSWTGNLSSNATENVTLTSLTANPGGNDFTAFTQSPNNGSDGNSSNDSKTVNFNAIAGTALPLTQGFQGTAFPPTNYDISNGDTDVTWERTTDAGSVSSASMYIDNWDYNAEGAYDWLVLPAVDFTGVTAATFSFDYAYAYYDGNQGVNYDSLAIAYSTDCGNSWFALYFEGGVQLATAGGQSTEFTPSSTEWANEVIDLNIAALNNQPGVQFAVVAINGYGNNLFVDNINIESASPAVLPVAEFTTSTTSVCLGSSVTYTNTSLNNPTTFAWSFPGGTPATSTQENPTVVYSNPGTYNVSLMATNSAGDDTELKPNLVVVNPAPSATISTTDVTCNNGTATVSVTGGAMPYTYSWTGSSSTSNLASGLVQGDYTVTVTDANQCSTSITGTIESSPNAIDLTLSVNDNSSNATPSSIQALVTGGTAPYSYSWSNGSDSSVITDLVSGTYTLTITDSLGCTDVETASIGNVGINNSVSWLNTITLYPNPTSSTLNLDLSLESKQNINLQVFSALGQVIYTKNLFDFQSGIEVIDMNNKSEGIYFLRIATDKEAKIVRFVKK